MIGSLRGVAQTISYEIRLALIILSLIGLIKSLRIYSLFSSFSLRNRLFLVPFVIILWTISMIAETNRTPFDFAEGESELVSGFNIEYGAVGFALIFIAEYGMILLLSN